MSDEAKVTSMVVDGMLYQSKIPQSPESIETIVRNYRERQQLAEQRRHPLHVALVVPSREAIEAALDRVIKGKGCELFGQPMYVTQPTGRARAVAWYADLFEEVLADLSAEDKPIG